MCAVTWRAMLEITGTGVRDSEAGWEGGMEEGMHRD